MMSGVGSYELHVSEEVRLFQTGLSVMRHDVSSGSKPNYRDCVFVFEFAFSGACKFLSQLRAVARRCKRDVSL